MDATDGDSLPAIQRLSPIFGSIRRFRRAGQAGGGGEGSTRGRSTFPLRISRRADELLAWRFFTAICDKIAARLPRHATCTPIHPRIEPFHTVSHRGPDAYGCAGFEYANVSIIHRACTHTRSLPLGEARVRPVNVYTHVCMQHGTARHRTAAVLVPHLNIHFSRKLRRATDREDRPGGKVHPPLSFCFSFSIPADYARRDSR